MRPTADDLNALEVLSTRSLSEWEEAFLNSLAEQVHWTIKQGQKFDEVWERVMQP